MNEIKCYYKICGLDAPFFTRKDPVKIKPEEKVFICNECMWKILQERWKKK